MESIVNYIKESSKQKILTTAVKVDRNRNETYGIINKKFYERYGISIEQFKKFLNKYIIPYLSVNINKLVIDIKTGDEYFYCYLSDFKSNDSDYKDNEKYLVKLLFKVKYFKNDNFYKFYDVYDKLNTNKQFANKIEKEINDLMVKYISKEFNKLCKDANIKPKQNSNSVELIEYVDYKEKQTLTITGKLEDIFSNYTTRNDRLKYVNGHYFKFKSKKIDDLYHLFTSYIYKGNYYLDNAVKRGVIID